MEYHISQRMKAMKPSAIREIFKYSADPSVISLSAGSPSPEALPIGDIARILDEIKEHDLSAALLYSQSEGHPPLREALRAYLRAVGCYHDTLDDLLVVSGGQQAMDLTCRALCDEGDTVICENPSFVGNLNCIRSYGVNLVGVPMDADGVNIEKLGQALAQNKRVRFIYLIPNFQNPTGITMSLEKRKACYALARQYGVPIFEDDPYGDLRFEGEALPSIKSLDTEGLVFYSRTFSKILSAGIRVGYLAAPKEVFGKLVVAKQCADVHSSMLAQLLCHRFLTECDLAAHIKQIGVIYKRKCGVMLNALDALPKDKITFTRPQGGLFVWCTLLDVADTADFALRLVRDRKVAVVPGNAFAAAGGEASPSFRITFASTTDEKIRQAVEIIGEHL